MNDNVVKFQRNFKTEIITPSDAKILDMDKHIQMTMEYISDPYIGSRRHRGHPHSEFDRALLENRMMLTELGSSLAVSAKSD